MGEDPQSILMYMPDGYMSEQIMHPGRPKFASGDWFRCSDAEIKEEALGYIAYSGPFHTDEKKAYPDAFNVCAAVPELVGTGPAARDEERGRRAPPEHGGADRFRREKDDVLPLMEAS